MPILPAGSGCSSEQPKTKPFHGHTREVNGHDQDLSWFNQNIKLCQGDRHGQVKFPSISSHAHIRRGTAMYYARTTQEILFKGWVFWQNNLQANCAVCNQHCFFLQGHIFRAIKPLTETKPFSLVRNPNSVLTKDYPGFVLVGCFVTICENDPYIWFDIPSIPSLFCHA